MKNIKLTSEQTTIINTKGNLKVNAVAGSGKTSSLIEYAKACPLNSKILYLAFNKTVKLEAVAKFKSAGLTNVDVETAHSLAFKYIIPNSKYVVSKIEYKPADIIKISGITGYKQKNMEYILASHINRFISYFCNSKARQVKDINYLSVITDAKAKSFVTGNYEKIESYTRQFLAKMNSAEIEVIHDFYLKKFQLSNPNLDYDYILFDEGQDASPTMLDIFLNQPNTTKLIVGDIHQQIYSWRFAINSLSKVNFPTLNLTNSFRFHQDIADLTMMVLSWKHHLGKYIPVKITGKGTSSQAKTRAVLARTNLALILKVIDFIEGNTSDKIYFEGNINSYLFAEDGTSLYDVLNLYNNRKRGIRNPLIKSMKDLDELKSYIAQTDDFQLDLMVEVVEQYGNQIPSIIEDIKAMNTDNKAKANIIFSTVHKSKGMEYDVVELTEDFISEDKLISELAKPESKDNHIKLNEEINILYVAITRAKSKLIIPECLLPDDIPKSKFIEIIKKHKPNNYRKAKSKKTKREHVKQKPIIEVIPLPVWNPMLKPELVNDFFNNNLGLRELSLKYGLSVNEAKAILEQEDRNRRSTRH